MNSRIEQRLPSLSRTDEGDRLLRIYLTDHDGASSGGIRLVGRCRKANEHTVFAPVLATLDAEISEDQEELRQILQRLRVRPSRTKRAAAWSGATVGRFKSNGHLFSYSPLSRVLELEALSSAVTAKLSLWITLGDRAKTDRRLDESKLIRLQRRARSQLDSLAELHRAAAELAFAAGQVPPLPAELDNDVELDQPTADPDSARA